ncbi:MAG: 30S ribosomal protein S16 [Candidatus Sericytochromatia bacterium]|nr:30S ribosomal protein S16 [Candidatus Sericytochromatia bacterium]
MVRIRLKRFGAKKKPVYRIVVIEAKDRRDGRSIEEIGFYDPRSNPLNLRVDVEAAQKWLKNGAQPSETVKSLLKKANVYSEAAAV